MLKYALILVLILNGCSIGQSEAIPNKNNITMSENNTIAMVEKVEVTGNANSYIFAVTVKSPDTGCVAKPCR